jgi:serine/threonine-protein phosphatase 2B catalytic subunit
MTSSDKTRDTSSAVSSSTTPKYSTTERNCKTIPQLPTHRLDIEDIYSHPSDPDDKPNLDILKQHLLLEGRLTEQAALRIIETGKGFIFFFFSLII